MRESTNDLTKERGMQIAILPVRKTLFEVLQSQRKIAEKFQLLRVLFGDEGNLLRRQSLGQLQRLIPLRVTGRGAKG